MKPTTHIRPLIFIFLTYLLGFQTTYAKTEVAVFGVENNLLTPKAGINIIEDVTNYNKIRQLEDVYIRDADGVVKKKTVDIYESNNVVAFKLLDGADEWMDDIFDLQKSVVNQNKNIIANASNNAKGAWGEMSSDVFLTSKGYQPLHPRKTALTQGWGETGIDGIFVKDGQYYIVEAKYSGTSQLKMTNDGKQMSDTGIQSSNRLDNILGPSLAQELRETGNYTRLLAKTQPDGTIIYKILDENANQIGSFTP